MHIVYLGYTCKAGESEDDYSDAFSPDCLGRSNVFAISDGATQGMLNREWARILVKSFSDLSKSRSDIKEVLRETIDKSIVEWNKIREQYVVNKNSVLDENEYRWLFEYGSSATFLGLTFDSDYWEAIAIGDTCSFVLDKKENCFPFPIEEESNFTDSPKLISSLPDRNADMDQHIKHVREKLEKENTFYLMTDALAHWFLSEYKMGKKPWNQINHQLALSKTRIRIPWPFKMQIRRGVKNALSTRTKFEEFEDWVNKLRESAEVVNDDTTLAKLNP